MNIGHWTDDLNDCSTADTGPWRSFQTIGSVTTGAAPNLLAQPTQGSQSKIRSVMCAQSYRYPATNDYSASYQVADSGWREFKNGLPLCSYLFVQLL